MKKIIIIVILCAAAVISLRGQAPDKIDIRDISTQTDTDTVNISFTASIGRKAARSGKTLVYAPVITDGEYKVSLPVIVIQGARAKKNWSRHEWAANTRAAYENGIYTKNGSTVEYAASVPFQPWMSGARIDIEAVTASCCNTSTDLFTMAADILPAHVAEPELEVIVPEPTTAEFVAEAFPFVLPFEDFSPQEPIKFYDDERDDALTIYYKINSYDIDKEFSGNEQTLINLIASINLIRQSGDSEVRRVVVAGSASPEGSWELNNKLAWNRAESVKAYIMENTGMGADEIDLFNFAANWRGLRSLIEVDPNVPDREKVLAIIDESPIWDNATQTGRTTLLRKLGNGRSYAYIRDNLFPKLRNGAFIRVYVGEKENRESDK